MGRISVGLNDLQKRLEDYNEQGWVLTEPCLFSVAREYNIPASAAEEGPFAAAGC